MVAQFEPGPRRQFRVGLGLGNPGLGESLGICARQVASLDPRVSAQAVGGKRTFDATERTRSSTPNLRGREPLLLGRAFLPRPLENPFLPQPKTHRQKGKGMRETDAIQSLLALNEEARRLGVKSLGWALSSAWLTAVCFVGAVLCPYTWIAIMLFLCSIGSALIGASMQRIVQWAVDFRERPLFSKPTSDRMSVGEYSEHTDGRRRGLNSQVFN